MDTLTNIPLSPGDAMQIAHVPEGSVPIRIGSTGGQPFLLTRGPKTSTVVDVRVFELSEDDDPAEFHSTWYFGSWTTSKGLVRHMYVEPPQAGGIPTYNRMHRDGSWVVDRQYSLDALVVREGVMYRCVRLHTSSVSTQPATGADWEDFWEIFALIREESYEHTQSTPSAVWTVNHNLGARRSVQVLSATGVVQHTSVRHVTSDQVEVTFKNPQTGVVVVS